MSSAVDWTFQPRQVGNALAEGGWSQSYQLGAINASPEFSFPLQLIYLNNRTAVGPFGSQWFCPQLESSLVPKGAGFLVWTLPSGGQMAFKPAERQNEWISFEGTWKARRAGPRIDLSDSEGWIYSYSKGRLDSLRSPTGRVLDFQWSGPRALTVFIRDGSGGAARALLSVVPGENRCVVALQINGQTHQFGYIKDGPDDRLSAWIPPMGQALRFTYLADSGILWKTDAFEGKKLVETAVFQCVYVPPVKAENAPAETSPKKKPANFWLKSDPLFDYSYPPDPKNKDRLLANQVSAKAKTGLQLKVSQSPQRGIVTATTGGAETKTYFYKAPGQKYDGKLRRVEKDGRLVAEYRYDRKRGLLTEQIDENGITTFFEYPAEWKPARAPDRPPQPVRITRGSRKQREVVAEFGYDDAGRIIVAKGADGQVTRYSYTPRGDLASVTGPEGEKTTFTYDAFGRRTSVARGDLKESVEYDEAGRVKARISPDGARTEFSFNAQGAVSAIVRDGKPLAEYLHDSQGRIIGEKDPLGRVKMVERDSRGNLLAETAPNGSTTRYEYDAFNRRIAQIDGNGNKISFEYDSAGRLIKQTNPLGTTLTWTYDPKGRLIGRSNGEQDIKQTYDENGRLFGIDYGKGETIAYEYDKEGRITAIATPDTGFHYVRNTLGQPEAVRLTMDDREFLLCYRYSPRGLRTGLVIAELVDAIPTDGHRAGKDARYETVQQTDYTYDSAGRLTSISSNGEQVVAYAYDHVGRPVKKTFGNGLSASLSYDSASRLTRIRFSGGPLGDPLDLAYTWDDASQVTSRTWNGQTQLYTYDAAGQLLTVTDAATKKLLEAYSYDKAGNMLEKTVEGRKSLMTYDAANQLVRTSSPEPGSLTYDRAGRLLASSDGVARTYGWLDKVTTLRTPVGESFRFTYWPDGQLATKKRADLCLSQAKSGLPLQQASEKSGDEFFLWDGLALLRRNETLYIIEPHPSGGVPIASHSVNKPQERTYYLNDLLGTTLATVEGPALRFASLTAFGKPLQRGTEIPTPSDLGGATPPAPVPVTPSLPQTP